MLVLSRKIGESVIIPGCRLTIKVVQVRGQCVRLAIEAPPEVIVHREEVWQRNAFGHPSPDPPLPTAIANLPR